eukprot:GEMP01075329.1.p1 GENE.GEMP01075329.1~~GEMP01075329.1.p1  ORF type:complete len:334 (+),score=59.45 GEMP01075329.1:59-1003(+)
MTTALEMKEWQDDDLKNNTQNIYDADWSGDLAKARSADPVSHAPTPQTIGIANNATDEPRCVKLSHAMSPGEALLIRRANIVSIVSILASLILGLSSVVMGVSDRALALVGLGLQLLLDAQSSALVIWRFKKPKERLYDDEAEAIKFKADRDARRERDSTYSVAIIFVACSIILSTSAIYKIISYDKFDETNTRLTMRAASFEETYSWPTGIIFAILAWLKWSIAYELDSDVLKLDALASFMGAFMALIVGIAGLLEDHDGAWIADPVAALFIASILLWTGIRTWSDLRNVSTKHQPFHDESRTVHLSVEPAVV